MMFVVSLVGLIVVLCVFFLCFWLQIAIELLGVFLIIYILNKIIQGSLSAIFHIRKL